MCNRVSWTRCAQLQPRAFVSETFVSNLRSGNLVFRQQGCMSSRRLAGRVRFRVGSFRSDLWRCPTTCEGNKCCYVDLRQLRHIRFASTTCIKLGSTIQTLHNKWKRRIWDRKLLPDDCASCVSEQVTHMILQITRAITMLPSQSSLCILHPVSNSSGGPPKN